MTILAPLTASPFSPETTVKVVPAASAVGSGVATGVGDGDPPHPSSQVEATRRVPRASHERMSEVFTGP